MEKKLLVFTTFFTCVVTFSFAVASASLYESKEQITAQQEEKNLWKEEEAAYKKYLESKKQAHISVNPVEFEKKFNGNKEAAMTCQRELELRAEINQKQARNEAIQDTSYFLHQVFLPHIEDGIRNLEKDLANLKQSLHMTLKNYRI